MIIAQVNEAVFNHDAQSGFFPDTHVTYGLDYRRFITSNPINYILEGNRGTGKTHILKMLKTSCTKKTFYQLFYQRQVFQILQKNEDKILDYIWLFIFLRKYVLN